MSRDIPPWKKRRNRVLEELRQKLANTFGVTLQDPFLTLRFNGLDGRLITVQLVASEVEVFTPRPEYKDARERKEGQKRREKVRKARVTDDWASPRGLGKWLCPESPTGFCWYDKEVDPLMDNCLGCGHPLERK